MKYLIAPKILLLITTFLTGTTGVIHGNPLGEKNQDNYVENKLDIDGYTELISNTILPQEKRYLVYKFVEKYEGEIDQEIIETMVERYYHSDNNKTVWQIKTTLGTLRTKDTTEALIDLLKDKRLREENDNDLFFSILPSILHEDKESHIEAVLDFLSEQEVSDTHYPPRWFMPIYKTKHTSHLAEIVELNSPRSKSLLNFLISIQTIANQGDQKDIENINTIRLAAAKLKNSESGQGISNLLKELLQGLENAPEKQVNNPQEPILKAFKGARDWEEKFTEQTLIWDKKLGNPERIEKRQKRSMKLGIERDINNAKSYYFAEQESGTGLNMGKNNEGEAVKMEEILDYINAIRMDDNKTMIKCISDLEAEANQKIINLGTYDSENSPGEAVTWGRAIK